MENLDLEAFQALNLKEMTWRSIGDDIKEPIHYRIEHNNSYRSQI